MEEKNKKEVQPQEVTKDTKVTTEDKVVKEDTSKTDISKELEELRKTNAELLKFKQAMEEKKKPGRDI
jgi:hypothetical protein